MYGILLLIMAVIDVKGCQQPLLPVYNVTGRRYLTCNSWEPDCPADAVCQRASAEWKERLYTNPEFAVYLCCNQDGRLPYLATTATTTTHAPLTTPPTLQVHIPIQPYVNPSSESTILLSISPADKENVYENVKHPKPDHNRPYQPAQFQQITQVQPDAKPIAPLSNHHTVQIQPPPSITAQSQQIYPIVSPVTESPRPLRSPPPSFFSGSQYPDASGLQTQNHLGQKAVESQAQINQTFSQSHTSSQIDSSALPLQLRIFSQRLEALLATKHLNDPQNPSKPSQGSPLQEQSQNGHSVQPPQNSSASKTTTQNQPNEPSKPSIVPPPGKIAAVAPQAQVVAIGNGNRVFLGPHISLLILGELTPPDKDMVYRYKGTVSLIQDSGLNILVDSGSANSKNSLIAALAQQGLRPQNIQVVIYTHAHPDHLGNDNLFPYAQKFFAGSVFKGDEFLPLQQLEEPSMRLTQQVEIWKTPGHTMQHNSVLVRNVSGEYVAGTVAISGDLFLNERDFDNPEQWTSVAVDKDIQTQLRYVILCQADYVVPGHGQPFAVTATMRSGANCSARKVLAHKSAFSRTIKAFRRQLGQATVRRG